MSSLSPGLLVLGLILGAVGGVLAARTVGWIFNRFPKTFSPSIQTAHTPVEHQTPQQNNKITCNTRSKPY